MKYVLPYPRLTFVLVVFWIALTELSVGQVVLAIVLGTAIPILASAFVTPLPRIRRPATAVRLLLVVLLDIALANMAVARLVLGPLSRLRPAFVEVPLVLTQPQSIALLASMITMTPGTVSVGLSADRKRLLVHCLDCPDSHRLVQTIKERYERPLVEIFGC